MRLHKPIGILLLLWPTLWALWIAAGGFPDLKVLIVFVLGVVLTRSAGCVINDYADRDIDKLVTRTRERPLTAGRVSTKEALVLFAALMLIAFALVLTMNRLTIAMSFVAVGLAAFYPFTKRFTQLPQFVLGLAFGWAVPMAFAAQTGQVPGVAWLILLATQLWAVIYDTMYAMVDRPDDLKVGIKSTAILFGAWDRHIMALTQCVMLGLLIAVGSLVDRGMFYYGGLAVASGLWIYQLFLIRHREPEACFRAFLNNQWVGAAIFAGLALDYAV
jgi:4-hydroxybenzoate polyprenyltransferase